MRTSIVLLAALLLSAATRCAFAQDDEKRSSSLMGSNAEGLRFMVGFMQNEIQICDRVNLPAENEYPIQTISIAARFDSTVVTIAFPNGIFRRQVLGRYEVFQLPVDMDLECIGEGVFNKGIEIVATRPISVCCFSSKYQTSDGYLALPVSAWGTEYVTANYPVDHYTQDAQWLLDTVPYNNSGFSQGEVAYFCHGTPRAGEFAIIAAENETEVTVYPKTRTVEGIAAGEPYTKRLMKGEIFQVQDGGWKKQRWGEPGSDITGSFIVANKPVGVLSGHVRAGVPTIYDQGKDHLIEMMPPLNTLGTHHMVIPFGGRESGDLVRVVASTPGITRFNITDANGSRGESLDGVGDFVEFSISRATVVKSDNPVLVAHYSTSALTDPRNAGAWRIEDFVANFDPYMITVTPEEQFVNAAVFQTLPNQRKFSSGPQQFDQHYVTIVVEREKFNTVKINSARLMDQPKLTWGEVPGTKYVWASLRIADGKIHVIESDGLFGGYVYGLGSFDSYGWAIGSGLRAFDAPADENPPQLSSIAACGGYTIKSTDSGRTELGLRHVWLDSSASTNALFDRAPIIFGDDIHYGTVTLADPRKPGQVRIIAEDLAGHRDTLDIVLHETAPIITPESIDLGTVMQGAQARQTIEIRNPGAGVMIIDSLVLLNLRASFMLDNDYFRVRLDETQGKINVTVLFQSQRPKEYHDTILVVVNCHRILIPLTAAIKGTGIATHDLDYGRVRVGRDSCMKLRVWNSGQGQLRLDSAVLRSSEFTTTFVLPQPIYLDGGRDTTLTVCFRPPGTGRFDGFVRFYSNTDSTVDARLTGVGIYPRLVLSGHDFGTSQLGDTGCHRVAIVNTGTDSAYLTGLDVADPNVFFPDRSVFPKVLAPGDTHYVPVCFSPKEERSYRAGISALNDDGLEATNELLGRGYALRAWISGKDWGRRLINSVYPDIVHIRNHGNEPIEIDSIWLEQGDIGDFRVDPLQNAVTIPAGGSIPVSVYFMPLQPGMRRCSIMARTSSRQTPMIDSLLIGEGLNVQSADRAEFDTTTAYACGDRIGRLTISNDGNSSLTISDFRVESNPPGIVVISNEPTSGLTIPAGIPHTIDFAVGFSGHTGETSIQFFWSFAETGIEYSREFKVKSEHQQYYISAALPQSVAVGTGFNLVLAVDSAHLDGLTEEGVQVQIRYNPTVVQFDPGRWTKELSSTSSTWIPVSTSMSEPGVLTVNFRTRSGQPEQLVGASFPNLPFSGFLGDRQIDTFQVSLTSSQGECVPMSRTAALYSLDSICGLSLRLFEFTGKPFALKQNSPNPVSAKTEIAFTLAMEAETKLEIYGVDGNLVRTLVDRTMQGGDYVIPMDAAELPSGLYYYRLTSGPFSATRPMQVVK